ncbi:hypothetical protein J6590_071815 [Homalodisca vitripennis]|nr:hypothetical protein J6590_071815 [Homalodisca vitripennis]
MAANHRRNKHRRRFAALGFLNNITLNGSHSDTNVGMFINIENLRAANAQQVMCAAAKEDNQQETKSGNDNSDDKPVENVCNIENESSQSQIGNVSQKSPDTDINRPCGSGIITPFRESINHKFPGRQCRLQSCLWHHSALLAKKERDCSIQYLNNNINRFNLPPTRITKISRTSIDIVGTNLNNRMVHVDVINNGISDHTAQLTSIDVQSKITKNSSSYRRHFSTQNLTALKNLIAEQDWLEVYDTESADLVYNSFINTLLMALNTTCSYKLTRRKQKKRGITDLESKDLRKTFIRAQERFIISGTQEDKIDASQKKNEYDLKLKLIRQEASEDLISNATDAKQYGASLIVKEHHTDRTEHGFGVRDHGENYTGHQ